MRFQEIMTLKRINEEKVEILNQFFASVFTRENFDIFNFYNQLSKESKILGNIQADKLDYYESNK